MNALVVCLLAVGACSAVPVFSPISVQYHSQDELGQYSYGYSGGPSAKHEVKTFDGVTRGGYSYIDSNGVIQSASYVADPFNGFRVAATNIPVGPAPVVAAPVVAAPVVVPQQVVDTPEVAAAKAAHFAAHAVARTRLRRSAPLNADGTVDDTPEVKAAKAVHFAAQATARSIPLVYNPLFYSGYYPYAPLNADGTVAETPEVIAAKSAHFAAHAVARGGLPYAYSPLLYRGYWPYAGAPLNIDGTVAETPEVVAAKAAHLAAHVEARSRSRRSAPLKPDGSVDDTLEVKLAKAAHYDAVARERGILPYYSPLVARAFPYVLPSAYWPYAPLNIDGTVAETPEVVSAKIAHFAVEGKYTFFIPVDEGFQPPPRPDKIDHKVIDGHIIPNKVLFTSATLDGQEFETLAFTDMLKVTVSFSTETDGKEVKKYVKSHTIVGDSSHPAGVVLAEIVKANIPVRNGVVHLIHRPLMVVDTTITEFLESFKDREDGPLYKFYEVIRDVEGDFMDRLTKMKELTLFAPSNAAWKDTNLNNFIRDRKRMSELLNMHLVEEKLTLEKIVYNNKNQVATMAPRRNLYFNVILNGGNKTLTVEGGGVNATVIQPDIAATNGIVHIIDRVLGVPFTTVGRKLATDPMLNKTYIMGRSEGFNDQLDEVKKKFTYFVPRDYAWNRMETKYPSAHKKLFMHDFAYHARQILERHLVVADQPYKMAELKNMTLYEAKELPTVRDVVKIKVKESEKSYYVEWNNEWVHVFRPDVECTNGVIHVIDAVFLRESDIHVTGSGEIVQPLRVTLGFIICLIISQYL